MVDKWTSPETLPPLGDEDVQIWRVDLPDETTSPQAYFYLLSPEERARAERLRAGSVRLQFVVARTVLRTILGNCLSLDPKAVPISQASFGKPETPGVFYNVAHSGATVLIALCRAHRVGIDVEYLSRDADVLEIAKHSFTATEYAALSSMADPADRRRAFFRCWTRKEAVIKADGRGLSLPLDSFEVPVGEAPLAQMAVPLGSPGTTVRYYVSDVVCADGLAAAFATELLHHTPHGFIFPLAMVAQKR